MANKDTSEQAQLHASAMADLASMKIAVTKHGMAVRSVRDADSDSDRKFWEKEVDRHKAEIDRLERKKAKQ